ncbi:flagellar basal-body MS-ring/collar protein FliF [Geochorda subterranea]|uniref:Flagellar M-ring protein n=1 Tax=Geochorda subterranea TaxID=3109564 RepID=A0ABZ1BSY9_9FIRM|nr:flagellar basal-body MS-ring/collar protein FliF [Limnochorda sp. LNt]WRP15942.1 flagellar basal-body MS-ring/collar protein FliF [Limnochorda sp. LNt]
MWERLRGQLVAVWQGMSRAARWAVLGGTVAAVGLIVLLVLLATPRYQPVFTGLSPEDLRAVTVALQQRGTEFTVDEGQGAVLVPEPQVHRVRLDLAMQGLPRNSVVGFEILNQTNLGLTDYERRLRYYWALQGELTRTIRAIQGVADARVHIVIPERSLFVAEQRPATASVLLELLPGFSLAPAQVRGIVNLVSNSVENLRPENVTVVDASGNVLSDLLALEQAGPTGNAVAERLQLKRTYERELERSLQATLEQVWGPGRVVVRVTADLSFDQQEERHEIFSPVVNGRSGIVRSEQRTEERFTGEGASVPAGVPGVTSNIPGYVEPAGAGGSSQMERLDSVTNYEINRVERRIVMAPGRIQRLSVAVWVDGQLDVLQRQRTEQLVAAAMGLEPSRGDQVTVEGMPFARAEGPSALEAQLLAARGPAAVRGVAWWLAALALAVGAAWWVSRRMRAARRRVDVVIPATPVAEEAVQEAPSQAEQARRRLRQEIEALARERPEEFVQLLRSWLVEESS